MGRKSVYLYIRIPVITLRVILIASVLVSVSFVLLLPLSFLSFNYLYGYLIPNPNIHLPFSNYILNYDFHDIPPFIIVGKTLDPLYASQPRREEHHAVFDGFDFNLNYDFSFKFDIFCPGNSNLKYEPIMYKLSIVSNRLVNKLSPYGTKSYVRKRFNLWPVTNNIHQLNNPQVLVSEMNTFILDCNRDSDPENDQSIYLKSLIPPIFEWLIPKVIQDFKILSRSPKFTIDLFKQLRFNDYLTVENMEYFKDQEFNILLEFNKAGIVINPSTSEIIIHTSWKGLRYYLYHYRIISYIIGISTLWTGSSLTLFSTVVGLVAWREINNTVDEADDDDIEDDDDDDDDDETAPAVNFQSTIFDVVSTTDREDD